MPGGSGAGPGTVPDVDAVEGLLANRGRKGNTLTAVGYGLQQLSPPSNGMDMTPADKTRFRHPPGPRTGPISSSTSPTTVTRCGSFRGPIPTRPSSFPCRRRRRIDDRRKPERSEGVLGQRIDHCLVGGRRPLAELSALCCRHRWYEPEPWRPRWCRRQRQRCQGGRHVPRPDGGLPLSR